MPKPSCSARLSYCFLHSSFDEQIRIHDGGMARPMPTSYADSPRRSLEKPVHTGTTTPSIGNGAADRARRFPSARQRRWTANSRYEPAHRVHRVQDELRHELRSRPKPPECSLCDRGFACANGRHTMPQPEGRHRCIKPVVIATADLAIPRPSEELFVRIPRLELLYGARMHQELVLRLLRNKSCVSLHYCQPVLSRIYLSRQ
jgi:hypothetical protein